MNDSVRNSITSRSSTYAQRSSMVDETSSLQGERGTVVEDGDGSPRSSMVSVRATLPPAPGVANASAQEAEASGSESAPVTGMDSQAIQKGLEAANKVGVKAAKLGFWGKLAGAVVTGIGLLAFGAFAVATGGLGPAAIAALTLAGAYFLKSCADTHMARRQLQNARAIAAGLQPKYSLPCGADAMAHLMYGSLLRRTTKGIDPNDTEAMARATQKAKNWAKGLSMGLDLALGISTVAITGAASGTLIEGLGFLSARVLANSVSSMLVSSPPERYQQDSIDLARRDLAFVEGQLYALRVDEPTSHNDPEALYRYQDQSTQLTSLRSRFLAVQEHFEKQVQAYERGLDQIDITKSAGVIQGVSEVVGASSDGADLGITVVENHGDHLAVFSSVGLTAIQSARSLRQLSRQEGLEEKLTQAFLKMNRDLKTLSKEALDFKTFLGMTPLQFEPFLVREDASEELSEPLLTEPLTVPVAPQAS